MDHTTEQSSTAGSASSAEGATSTVVLGATRPGKD